QAGKVVHALTARNVPVQVYVCSRHWVVITVVRGVPAAVSANALLSGRVRICCMPPCLLLLAVFYGVWLVAGALRRGRVGPGGLLEGPERVLGASLRWQWPVFLFRPPGHRRRTRLPVFIACEDLSRLSRPE